MSPPNPQPPGQPWPVGKVISLLMVVAAALSLGALGLNAALDRLGTQDLAYEFNSDTASIDSCIGSFDAMGNAAGLQFSDDAETTFETEASDHDRYLCSFRAVDHTGKDIGPIDIRVTIHSDRNAVNPSEQSLDQVRQDSGIEVLAEEIPGYEFGYCYGFTSSGDGAGTQMCRARDGNLELDIDASTRSAADVHAMAAELMPFLKSALSTE